MPDTKTFRVPAQLRKHIIRNVKPKTQGERELMAACEAGARELERQGLNNMNSIDLELTNAALGVALKLARSWMDHENGNNVMAAKSMLKWELEYTPDDPRETRHAVKFPKSLVSLLPSPFDLDLRRGKGIPKDVQADLAHMSWTTTGTSGRVNQDTLGWVLDFLKKHWDHPTPAVQRAVRKFIGTHTEAWEQTQRLINGYLGTDEEEPERKRLVVIACGGKKSDRPGKIPADERYTGNYFTACLQAAEVMDGPTMILSAKYGLVSPTEEIENYDVKWGGPGSIRLATVKAQVEALGLTDAKVTVLGGERYVTAARQLWPDAEAPLKGGIGQQLKQLANIYDGEVLEDDEDQAPSEGASPKAAYQTKLQEIHHLPSRGNPKPRAIWFGGKAGRFNPHPGPWEKAEVIYTGEGQYAINRYGTTDELWTGTLRSLIHWAPLEEPNPVKDPLLDLIAETAPPKGGYEVPANFLELAEEGNTEAAKRYWKRRCEEYARTGK
ncbi:DUF6884 domain-containing protein [Streptomyces longwoodensis]